MDYGKLPVTELLRGPLLHTPQGLVVVICAIAYLSSAGIVWLFQLPPPIGKTREIFFIVCISWPFIVFLMFVRDSTADFRSSWATATWVAIYGSLPIIFRVVDGLRA